MYLKGFAVKFLPLMITVPIQRGLRISMSQIKWIPFLKMEISLLSFFFIFYVENQEKKKSQNMSRYPRFSYFAIVS